MARSVSTRVLHEHIPEHIDGQVQVAVYHRGLGLVRLFLYALVVAYAATQMTIFHKFAVFETPTSTVQLWLDRNGTGYARPDPMARPYCAPAYLEKTRFVIPGGFNFSDFSCAVRDMTLLQSTAPNEVSVTTSYVLCLFPFILCAEAVERQSIILFFAFSTM